MDTCKYVAVSPVVLALAGTYMLAFGLKIIDGRHEGLPPKPNTYTPIGGWSRPWLIRAGLALITLGAGLQIYLILGE